MNELQQELHDLRSICQKVDYTEVHFKIMQLYSEVLQEYNDCEVSNNALLKIDSIIDYLHEEIHSGHWSEVAVSIRSAYTTSSILKILIMLMITPEAYEKIIYIIDMSFLLGATVENSDHLLTGLANKFSSMLPKCNDLIKMAQTCTEQYDLSVYSSLYAVEVDTKSNDSFNNFYDKYFLTYKPVKITNGMNTWPAMKKWKDIEYLLEVAAYRTVPIEIGSKYSDENWSQKIMLFKDYIRDYFVKTSGQIGYLAQHNLFEQIPELFKDVQFPKYVEFSRDVNKDFDEPDCNVWFGPKGTVSPLHYDPRDNILAQVFGSKQIILFSADDSEFLYPHDTTLLGNTAQVDPVSPDLTKYPNFVNAKMYKCFLNEGELLYIPKKWWHHVTSLQKSFSVNFWWQ